MYQKQMHKELELRLKKIDENKMECGLVDLSFKVYLFIFLISAMCFFFFISFIKI